MKKYYSICTLQPQTVLYRFVDDLHPLRMTPNEGKKGRCNKNRNMYYCCRSIQEIRLEFGHPLDGYIIVSEVIEPIKLGWITHPYVLDMLRGRVLENNEQPEMLHKMVLQQIGRDCVTNYETTNRISDAIIDQCKCDGIIYPSWHDMTIWIGNTLFYVSDEPNPSGQFEKDKPQSYTNIALTEDGYKKIKEGLILKIRE